MNHRADTDRIKTLLARALQRDGDDRSAFLDEHCSDDAELRERLEELLGAYDRAEGFLEEPPSAVDDGEVPGAVIGRYKLLQAIGEGGFGVVWMAEQLEPVRRKVALKIIKLGMDTKQVVARFEAERQALALMDHPNIAKVLDGGVTEKGRPFFVMELVRGVTITEYCDEARLSTQARLELFIRVCHAVQHAHQKGIIHRDIKPSNVLVTLHDGSPVPMVIDFGIAKATSGSLTDKTLFTEFRQFLGTPEYMSPEQAEISGLDVDTRADIYSLGVLLYELLTGTTPVDGKTLRAAAYDELLRLIREVDPPRPSTRISTLGEQVTGVAQARATEPNALQRLMRGDIDWIVMKALEKERTRRYESAASFAEDVQRHLAHEPIIARPPSRVYRLRKFVQRNRVGVIGGTLVALTLIVGSVVSTVGFVRAARGRDDARAAEALARAAAEKASLAEARERSQRERAIEEAAAAVEINAFYDEMLLSIDPLRLRQRSGFAPTEARTLVTAAAMDRDVSVVEMLRGAAAAIDDSFQGKPKLEAKVRETIGVTLLGLGEPSAAARQLELAAKLLSEASETDAADHLRLELLRGAAATAVGENAVAEALVRSAHEGMQRVHGAQSPRTLHAASLLGNVLTLRGDYDEAEAVLSSTLASQRRALGEHRDTVDTLNHLTDMYLWQSQPLAAEPHAREAYEISGRILDPDDIVRAEAESALGVVLEFNMDFLRAEELLRSSLAKKRRLAGGDHESLLLTTHHLARCLQREADRPERERLMREAVSITRSLKSEASPKLNIVRHDLALYLFEAGEVDEAVLLARQNVDGYMAWLGPTDPRTHEAVAFLRDSLRRAGRLEDAEQIYREVVELRELTYGPEAIRTCSALGDLCRFLRACGKLEEAGEAWQGCLDLRHRLALQPDAGAWSQAAYGNMLLHPWAPGMRDVADALGFLELGIEMGLPQRTEALTDLTLAYVLAGRDQSAAEIAARDLERSAVVARSGALDDLLAHAELLLGCPVEGARDPQAALDYLMRALELDETSRRAWRLVASTYALFGEREEARDATARWLELLAARAGRGRASVHDIRAYLRALASTQFEELRSAGALTETHRALERRAAKEPDLIGTLGLALYRLERYEESAARLEQADELNSQRGFAYNPALDRIALAMCRHHLGNREGARELVDACLPLVDDDLDLSFVEREELRSLLREAKQLIGPSAEPAGPRGG